MTTPEIVPAAFETGVRHDMPREDYDAIEAYNYSRLKHLSDSALHAKWRADNQRASTDAMALGRAVHTAIFESRKFDEEFAVRPLIDRRTKRGRSLWQAHELTKKEGVTVLAPKQKDAVEEMASAVDRHPGCRALLSQVKVRELTVLWRERIRPDRDVPCKARIDTISAVRGWPTIVDLKTTSDASDHGFASAMHRYQYHLQAGWYVHGFNQIEPNNFRYVFIVVESSPPWDVRVLELDQESIDEGREQALDNLRLLDRCIEDGDWPGRGDGRIGLPRYAFRRQD